ncbi:MAG: diacylglycerol kinase [Bacillota bacterium]
MASEVRRLIIAFANSLRGWAYLLRTEANTRYLVLLLATVLGLRVAGFLHDVEFALILLATSLAVVAEILNTAIEDFLDMMKPMPCERVRRIKDMTSAAVFYSLLLCALMLLLFLFPTSCSS